MVAFGIRIFVAQGWYIVTYALAIYHLNLLLAFLTPKIDPDMMKMDLPGCQHRRMKSSVLSSGGCQSSSSGTRRPRPRLLLSAVPFSKFSTSRCSGRSS